MIDTFARFAAERNVYEKERESVPQNNDGWRADIFRSPVPEATIRHSS